MEKRRKKERGGQRAGGEVTLYLARSACLGRLLAAGRLKISKVKEKKKKKKKKSGRKA